MLLNMSTNIQHVKDRLTEWVDAYGDDLYAWASYKTSDNQLAEDLVQETFLSAFRSFNTFRKDSKARTWLFNILNNKIIDHYRKKKAQIIDITDGEGGLFDNDGKWNNAYKHADWQDTGHLLDDEDFNMVLRQCIGALPPDWSLILSAKYDGGRKSSDVCQEMGITTSNYWQIIHRAKLNLKKCLEANWFSRL